MSASNPGQGKSEDVGHVVHAVLLSGLVVSSLLLLIGVGLTVRNGGELPRTASALGELPEQVRTLQPAGFLVLGLLALMATPLLRVAATLGISLVRRDWAYVAITGTVLAIMITSILLGKG
jgi:uncharacterized membrane protein